MVVEDFNSVVSASEVSNQGSYSIQRSSGFINWILDECLLDLGFNGSRFTWMKGSSEDSHRSAQLDRGLSNMSWRHKFVEASVFHLPCLHYDHNPILVSLEGAKMFNVDRPLRVQAA